MNNDKQRTFWEQQNLDVQGMMLNEEAGEFEDMERQEILGYLPDLTGKRILEPAAGIGRFTTQFAAKAGHVTALDFVEQFIDQNRAACAGLNNVTLQVSDIMEAEFPPESFDHIFINWLLMYLTDDHVGTLSERLQSWLAPGGTLFLRESCVSASNPNAPHPHTHYRDPEAYEHILTTGLSLVNKGQVQIYVQRYNNPNQRWWLFSKGNNP